MGGDIRPPLPLGIVFAALPLRSTDSGRANNCGQQQTAGNNVRIERALLRTLSLVPTKALSVRVL